MRQLSSDSTINNQLLEVFKIITQGKNKKATKAKLKKLDKHMENMQQSSNK